MLILTSGRAELCPLPGADGIVRVMPLASQGTLGNSNGSAEDLAVFVYDRGDGKGLRIDFDANPALYCAKDLADHQQRLVKLLDAIIRDPGRPIGGIDILDTAERRRGAALRRRLPHRRRGFRRRRGAQDDEPV